MALKKILRFCKVVGKKILRVFCLSAIGLFVLYPTGLPEPKPRSLEYEYALIPQETNIKFPLESFVFITVRTEEYGGMSVSASGIVIQTLNDKKSYILTAGHACEPLMVLAGLTRDLPTSYESTSVVTAYDYFGYPHETKIVGISIKDDLCLLESDDIWNQGLPISKTMPRTGEKVYSIAAPRSIFSPGNALIFDGYYTGLDEAMDAYFTIPARPGSSGAGIFNKNGEIVGIVHSASENFESMSIASPVYDIDSFLSQYVIFISY